MNFIIWLVVGGILGWLATNEAVSSFGAAASLALVLLWFYYSAVIFYSAAIIAAGDVRPGTKAQ